MRYWVLAVVLGLILSFAAACGGDDGDNGDAVAESDSPTEEAADSSASDQETDQEEPTATSEPEPTATPEPEPTATPSPTPEPEPENEESNTTGELSALLLTVEDMPEGWVEATETEVEAGTDMEVADVEDQPFEAPCGAQPLEDTFDPQAEASRTFQGSELGPFFSQNVAQLESTEQAEQVMNQIREVFGCEEWVETDEFGDEITFEITETQLEQLGDEVFGVEMSMSFANATEMESQMLGNFGFTMAFVRTGEYLNMFAFIDIFGMSEVDFQGLMQQANEKIQANT